MSKYDYEVTCAARDGSDVQELLKNFFEADLESGSYDRNHTVKFEEYDDQGAKAYAVLVDDKEIGSVKGDDVAGFEAFAGKAASCKVEFGVNGHGIEEYENIIDRYKDKKFWKETDPNFNDAEVNKAYNDLMSGMKKGAVYSAALSFPSEKAKDEEAQAKAEADAALTDEERKYKEDMDKFVQYFKIIMPLSIVLILIGILFFIKISRIMGLLNLLFGIFGLYFSWKYTMRGKKRQKK